MTTKAIRTNLRALYPDHDVKVSKRDGALIVSSFHMLGAELEAYLAPLGWEGIGHRFHASSGQPGVLAGEVYGGRHDFRHKYEFVPAEDQDEPEDTEAATAAVEPSREAKAKARRDAARERLAQLKPEDMTYDDERIAKALEIFDGLGLVSELPTREDVLVARFCQLARTDWQPVTGGPSLAPVGRRAHQAAWELGIVSSNPDSEQVDLVASALTQAAEASPLLTAPGDRVFVMSHARADRGRRALDVDLCLKRHGLGFPLDLEQAEDLLGRLERLADLERAAADLARALNGGNAPQSPQDAL
jgi:hypothetical protein